MRDYMQEQWWERPTCWICDKGWMGLYILFLGLSAFLTRRYWLPAAPTPTPMVAVAPATVTATMTPTNTPTPTPTPEPVCGRPLDVVLMIDTTSSMSGAIDNIQLGIGSIVGDVVTASHNDYQFGVITFKDTVFVEVDLAPLNRIQVEAAISRLTAEGGAGGAEASDEAINLAVNNSSGALGGTWRDDAVKILILVTDAPPGGLDDEAGAGDFANARARAEDAARLDIRIAAVFVPTEEGALVSTEVIRLMQDYAGLTDGSFVVTQADGGDTANVIESILADPVFCPR